MEMTVKENTDLMIRYLGGAGNIVSVNNCMTRLRVNVRDEAAVEEDKLRTAEDVLGLVHDREGYYEIVVGPGKARKYADQCRAAGLSAGPGEGKTEPKPNPGKKQNRQEGSRLKSGLKTLGEIFVPLIPGIITAGLCAGFAALIAQTVPDYRNNGVWGVLYQLLSLINTSFMTYLTAWAGYRAAERFGATPILGGMLGMITSLEGINEISVLLGLYNESSPLNSILRTGKGGVLAVIAGVFILARVEKKIRSRMPESVDVIFTPLFSLLVCAVPYILIIMPLLGYVSGGIVWFFSKLCLSDNLLVRIAAGYVSTALFLPLVAAGMHHGLVALYTVQLQEIGYVTLYPALAMAGAGQVGAAAALWIKGRKAGNRKLCSVITGALPAGILGIGEPLIYGVTLPLGKPFITAGLGAGFGGALVMAMRVASTTWGPSGVLGVFVMTAGPQGAIRSVLFYLAGLAVAYACSFIITALFIRKETLLPEDAESAPAEAPEQPAGTEGLLERETDSASPEQPGGTEGSTERKPASASGEEKSARMVRHGEEIRLEEPAFRFEYTVTDPVGIHARPAGKLAETARKYRCEIAVSAGGKSASARSPIALMNLGAGQGTVLSVRAEGKDAEAAIQALKAFFQENL